MYDLTRKSTIKRLLEEHGAAPLHRLGQHFLIDRAVVADMVRFAQMADSDILIEIGTGLGTVSVALARSGAIVTGVEIDKAMARIAAAMLTDAGISSDRFSILNKNILDVEISTLAPKHSGFTLVSSLPYYLTSPILKKILIQEERKPGRLVLLMQKEVAQRMSAAPPHMNFLAVMIQLAGNIEIKRDVSPGSFWPQPDVQSSLVVIEPHASSAPQGAQNSSDSNRRVIELAHGAFQQKRKKLAATLTKHLNIEKEAVRGAFEAIGLDPAIRPENLTIDNWRDLATRLND